MTDIQTENNPPSLKQQFSKVRPVIKPAIQHHIGKPSIREARRIAFKVANPLATRLEEVKQELKKETQKKEEAEKKSIIDNVTKLHNRAWFYDELNRRIAEAKRRQKEVWVLYFDIDHFKKINDRFGHEKGDKVLNLISHISARKEEPICRLGGEEFAQILDEDITEEQIPMVMARYSEKMKEMSTKLLQFYESEQKKNNGETYSEEEAIKQVTMSFGAARHQQGNLPNKCVELADQAMYKAKKTGRNKGYIAYGYTSGVEYKEVRFAW